MPLKFTGVRGRPALMFLRRLGTLTSPPATVTVTVASAAAADAKQLSVAALTGPIPKNTVLEFTRAAGNPNKMRVVVTQDADVSDTTVHVEAFEGADGEGIPYTLAMSDAATWDGLFTDFASNSLDFSANEQTNELTAVTHGAATGVRVAVPEVTAVSPTITRQGLFLNDSQLLTDLLQNVKTPNAYWWGKLVLPDQDGVPLFEYAGLGVVSGVSHPTPVDNFIQLNYSFRFVRDAFTVTNLQATP